MATLTQDFIQQVLASHKQTMAEADFHYQVTYCETKYCHRYINFEIEAD